MKKRFLGFVLALIMALTLLPANVFATDGDTTEALQPTACNNTSVSLRRTSSLMTQPDGYMRVFYDGNKINVEYYDKTFHIKSARSVSMELRYWGGFYAGLDGYYYVAEGQANEEENDAAEVIRIIKYDKDWRRVGAAAITGNNDLFGGEVRYPFDYGCVEMTEVGDKLYIVTGHEGYVDDAAGQGHQGMLTIEVDKPSMSGKIVASNLWHSFAQYIVADGEDLYTLEQSEGSRMTSLAKSNAADPSHRTTISVLDYGGDRTSMWAISCYASVDGVALSKDNILGIGTSIDQSNYDNVTDDTAHNIYLTITPKANFSTETTTVKWLTDNSENGACYVGLNLTKINDDKFMVSWEEYGKMQEGTINDTLSKGILHYMFIDGNGNVISTEFTAAATISECRPIVDGEKAVFYTSDAAMVDFYTINTSTGEFAKTAYRVAGPHATWKVSGTTLTLSGTGKIYKETEGHFRWPISTTARAYTSSDVDGSWKTVREKVTKIVVKEGLTEISSEVFGYFKNLTEVIIEPGLTKIGKEAFAHCSNLSKVVIPRSVTSIGADAFWSGYFWMDNSHAYFTTIYAPVGSYAITYAQKHGIGYTITNEAGEVCKTHKYVATVKKPTYKAEGYTLRECSVCGDSTKDTYTPMKQLSQAKITSVANTKDGITVKWNKVTGATAYQVYRKVGTGSWKLIKTTTSTSLTNTKLTNGSKYQYKVRAIVKVDGKIVNKGAYSTIKTMYRLTRPTLASGTKNIATKKIVVKWNKNTKAAGYQIKYVKGATVKTVKVKGAASLSKTLSSLTKGSTYKVSVRSYKTVSGTTYYSAYSAVKSVKVAK